MNNNFVFIIVYGIVFIIMYGGCFYNRVWDCFSSLVMQPKWYLDVVTITYPRTNPN
mgnify:CR=1 FL=1